MHRLIASLPCFLVSASLATVALAESVSHLRVSTFSRSAQFEASLCRLSDGGFVAAWTSRRQQGGTAGVYLQRLDRDGVPIGGETQVNLWTPSAQSSPSIAALRDGGAIVVWQSFGQDGDQGSIIARYFDPMMRGGSEELVNVTTEGDQSSPVVTIGDDGRPFVAWVSARSDGMQEIRGRWIAPHAREELLSTANDARAPSVATLADGSLIVAWTSVDENGTSRIERAMVARGHSGPITVESIVDEGYEAALAACGRGAVMTWAIPTADGHAVRAIQLDEYGCPIGHAIDVGDGVAASPLSTAEGFAIAYANQGVLLARYGPGGDSLGPAERLTEGLPGSQSLRVAAGTTRAVASGDRIAVIWDGDAGLGDDTSVNMSLVAPQAIALAGRQQGVDPKSAPVTTIENEDRSSAAPHIPPTFDPRGVDRGRRTIAANDNGIGFDAILDTGWTPPDCNMAVGPNQVVTITNGRITFLDKQGTQLFTDEIEGSGGFWGSLGATDFVFDPECFFDTLSNRFWAMASEGNAPGGKSYALIAVSDDDNPVGSWNKYRLETTSLGGSIFDSPNISVDDEAVYVTGDGSISNHQIFIWDKASMLAGVAPAISKSLNYVTSIKSAGIPPVMDPSAPGLYMIEHKESATNTKVKFIALTNPLTTPTLTTTELTVPSYTPPANSPQKGTSVQIQNFDSRFWSVDYKNGSLWATHHVGSTRVLVRWYEFAMNGWPASGNTPTLVQTGSFDLGPTVRTFMSAIGADDAGNAAITFARSSPTEYISMVTALRAKSDPLNTFRTPAIIKTNTGPYTEAGRWGDYAAARADPVPQPNSIAHFWANHEYAVNASTWRSWVQELTLPAAPGDLNADGVVDASDLAILLGAWGGPGPLGDLDGNGVVDASDLALLLGAWS